MPVWSHPEDAFYSGAAVYMICSPQGTPYIGQTKNFKRRMKSHKSAGCCAKKKRKRSQRVYTSAAAIAKHGWENMEITILERYLVYDQLFLDKREIHFIAYYDSYDNGYNETLGGGGTSGYRFTKEQKRAMGELRKGKKHKHETKRKISIAQKGRKHSREQDEKHSIFMKGNKYGEGNKGKKRSHEHKAKISATHKGKPKSEQHRAKIGANQPNARPVIAIEGNTKWWFTSASAAARRLTSLRCETYDASAISKCCKCSYCGNKMKYKGIVFRFDNTMSCSA